ncbi:MAG: putative motility protein [Phycisphaeraceae bacterium]
MSISAASASAMQQGQIGQKIAYAVAGKQLDAAKQQGEAVVSLMQQAADLQQELTVDGTGKGQHIDVRA